ncbi:MAG: hypothetical protein LBT44_01800 [Clostridiales bacterium]|jgi:hypothetical protein|nr:hypothetical protein [Clostridiales bacterium]
MTLQEFLNHNTVDGLTADVPVSSRFIDEAGKPMLFKIKAMTQNEFDALRKRCTKIMFERGQQKTEFDGVKFNMSIIVGQTVYPSFKDAQSLEALGCATPESYVNKVLLPGEVSELLKQINTLSGFDTDINVLVEDAKN